MSKMLPTIQSLFPMSKGAYLAVTFLSLAGGAGYVQLQSNMEQIIDLQEKTREDIHNIDVRLTVVEHRLDNTIVFKSAPEEALIVAEADSMYSNPYMVNF